MYRAAVIGLGWMGLLYDLAGRIPDRFEIGDTDRPTPPLDIGRTFHHYDHPGDEGNPTSYSEALVDRPEVELIAGADRDEKRLRVFGERYGIQALYPDSEEMLRQEKPDLVAVCTNTSDRADLTCLAVACGARGVVTEKPMVHTLEEADRMVATCEAASVPLCCGAITTTHPSFARARELVQSGAIGALVSMEACGPGAQHQNWSYFLDHRPAWVVGTGDSERRESGSDEFSGQGMMETEDGLVVHFRRAALPSGMGVRLSGAEGEMTFGYPLGWRLWQDVDASDGKARVEMPWPKPQFAPPYGGVYCVADVVDCMEGRLDEPKNSGRRVAVALEVEIALKLSASEGSRRVDLPLEDRSLGLHYDWFR